MLRGIGASDGIGIGKALKLVDKPIVYEDITVADTAAEKQRLQTAVQAFCSKCEAQAKRMDETGADGAILRGHIAMLSDPYMLSQMSELIDGGACAEKAVESVCDMFIAVFSAADDELTRQRAADVGDIKRRMQKLLLGIEDVDLSCLPPNTVLVVDELTPSMTAEMDKAHVAGVITQRGGKTSHSAIISRSLKIPAVLSVENALTLIPTDSEVIVDGHAGEVYTDIDDAMREQFLVVQKRFAEKAAEEERHRGKPTVTQDGIVKKLYANIGSHKDLDAVQSSDAEGIGLFRTEFLFMDRSALPTEEEQFEAYKTVAVGMRGREVIIRTLDVGGDKDIPYLNLKKEENPFMGFRAVRYCLANREVYKTQLRAILRASAYGNIAVMVPLVTRVDELCEVRAIIEELKTELDNQHIPYKKHIRVGAMIETPAACLIADLLAQHADFFSIGTNDLTGYVMAADRGNADVGYLYSTLDPAVLRAIRHIIACAVERGIPCGMCGEAAADPHIIPLLVSFGLDEFSVNPAGVLSVRAALSKLSGADCDAIAEKALSMQTEKEVSEYLLSL